MFFYMVDEHDPSLLRKSSQGPEEIVRELSLAQLIVGG